MKHINEQVVGCGNVVIGTGQLDRSTLGLPIADPCTYHLRYILKLHGIIIQAFYKPHSNAT